MLKKVTMLLLLFWGQQHGFAQFSEAKLQATGLTCALCSKAIHQALEKLPFVQKVSARIKESAFDIVAKPGESIAPDQIRAAVEDAGFFIGALYLSREQSASLPVPAVPFKEGATYFCVLEASGNGQRRAYQVLNEHFLTEKASAKISASPLGATLRQQPVAIDGSPVFYLKSQ
jgi:copper chaperone CopZ